MKRHHLNHIKIASVSLLLMLVFTAGLQADPYEDARKELKAKYGVEPKRWQGWVDEEKEGNVVAPFEVQAKKLGISASYLYTLAAGEGLILWFEKHSDLKGKIDGYDYLGADLFCSDAPRLIKAGFLRNDYTKGKEYTCEKTRNEQGKDVTYGVFRDYTVGVEAFCALVAHRRSLFLAEAENLKLGVATEDQTAFWAYAYYVDGEGDAAKHLKATGLDYTKSTRKEVKDLALMRLSSWRYVQKFSIIKN